MARIALVCGLVAALSSAAIGGAPAFRWNDDFGAYKTGSDGAPVWDASGIGWEVVGGKYVVADATKSFAILAKAPYAKRVTLETTVTVRKAMTTGWKVAGVVVMLDARNYWHFALVEAPDDKDREHFIELTESLDGTWLAQSQPSTKLTELESLNPNVAWKYNHPYRLRIELTGQEIAGTLSELDGKVIACRRYKLDNKAVTWGQPALDVSGLGVAFDDVAAKCDAIVPPPKQEKATVPAYTQAGRVALPAEPLGKATGFFHVEQHGGRWWVIDPKGQPFYIVGTDHANFRSHWCEKLGYAPYNRNMVKQFRGDEDKWAASTAERLLSWGFNSLGAGHSPSLRHRGLAWMGFAHLGSGFAPISDICPKVHWTGFPNVFHPKFQLYCEKVARRMCSPHKDDPWLLGYFIDNELEWYGKGWRAWELCDEIFRAPATDSNKQALIAFLKNRYPKIEQLNAAWGTKAESYEAILKARTVLREQTNKGRADRREFIMDELGWGKISRGAYSLTDEVFKKPADHSAKQALMAFLKKRYPTIARLNKAWGTKVASYEALAEAVRPVQHQTERGEQDKIDFLRLIAERYFAITSAAIRKHDPNHMVLGTRFAGTMPPVGDIAGKHCDIFTINCYRRVNLETGEVLGFQDDLAKWYADVKRPFMITEWSFPALDAGLPCKHGAGMRVDTQAEKAKCFTIFQKLLFATPFMVGSNYFMWVDEPAQGISSTFPEDSNYGLVDVNNKPYKLLTEAATRLHPQVYQIHSSRTPSLSVKLRRTRWLGIFPWGRGWLAVVSNAGRTAAKTELEISVDGKKHRQAIHVAARRSVRLAIPGIDAPTGHYVRVVADPDEAIPEVRRSDNVATAIIPRRQSPGLRRGELPVTVINASDEALRGVPVVVPLGDGLGLGATPQAWALKPDSKERTALPCQLDVLSGGAEVVIVPPELPAFGMLECAVDLAGAKQAAPGKAAPRVRLARAGDTWTVDNGVLRLIKQGPGGSAFDKIGLNGKELGRFVPVIWQDVGQNMWPQPDTAKIVAASNGPVRLVLDIEFELKPTSKQAVKTEVGAGGKYAQAERQPGAFRTCYRFVFYHGKPWFSVQFQWIENTDTRPWDFQAYFHYALSNLAGDATDDVAGNPEVPNYYASANAVAWSDAKARLHYGITATASDHFRMRFWLNAGGGQHADVRKEVRSSLKPGERYAAPQPVAYIFGASGATARQAWAPVVREIRRANAVQVQLHGAARGGR